MNSGRQQLWVLAAACITLLLLSWAAFNASANGCGSLCRCEEAVVHSAAISVQPPDVAVMLNFHHKSQREKAEAAIGGTWKQCPPCRTTTDEESGRHALILHVETAAAAEEAATMLTWAKSLPHMTRCFDRWHVTHANLQPAEDKWPVGPTQQFYNAMREAHALGVDYVLQVEPDVRPIRAGWLSQAATLAAGYEQLLPPEGFWMLGSPPRTPAVSASKRLAQRLHINGNAIYHVGSTAFMAFLDGVEKNKADNSAWQEQAHGRAYDVDLASFLMQKEHFQFAQDNVQKYVYHPFVVNFWRRDWTQADMIRDSLSTYLVHGGNVMDEAA